MADILPPSAIDTEAALLGAILLNPAAYWDVAGFLHANDFYLETHRWIYEAIANLQNARRPVDERTISDELEAHGRLSDIGGFLVIAKLSDGVPSAIHAEAYGRQVESCAVRRRLIGAASMIAQMAYDGKSGIDTTIERAERELFAVAERRSVGELLHVKTAAAAYYERVMELKADSVGVLGPPTGFTDLDNLLGGLGRDNVTIFAGRPGIGKTSFLLNVVTNVAQDSRFRGPVAMFSLEMSREQLAGRLVAGRAKIDSSRLRVGNIKDSEAFAFNDAVGWLGDLPLYLDDTAGLSASQLRSRCRRLAAEYGGIRLIVVDYIQLMTSDRQYDSKVHEMSYVSGQLKALARELSVPVLAAAQLSRSPEMRADKHPILSDLRESGAIEQDADVVMFIYRDDYYLKDKSSKPHVAEIEIAKNRHGPTGVCEFYWDGALMQYKDLAHASDRSNGRTRERANA